MEFDKICRGCLDKRGEMRPLFGTCLDKMLKSIANIEVSFFLYYNKFNKIYLINLFYFIN